MKFINGLVPKLKVPELLADKFVLNITGADLLEYFLIAAVSSLLIIRAFLNLTGFPQIGGGDFHIAHMLWGGLFMFIAIIFFSVFINSTSKIIAVVLGGIGFGTFIDELGKFITADNNYFYRPTISAIYLIFVAIFLLIKYLSRLTSYSSKTYLVNSIEMLKEAIIFDLDKDERNRALKYLRKSNLNDPMVKSLVKYIKDAVPKNKTRSVLNKIFSGAVFFYKNLLRKRVIAKSIVGFFLITSVIGIFVSLIVLVFGTYGNFIKIAYFLSSSLVGLFSITGLYFYQKKKILSSYTYLKRAAVISIFVTQYFNFLINELSSIVWLGLYLSVYSVLKATIQNHTRAEVPKG